MGSCELYRFKSMANYPACTAAFTGHLSQAYMHEYSYVHIYIYICLRYYLTGGIPNVVEISFELFSVYFIRHRVVQSVLCFHLDSCGVYIRFGRGRELYK